MTIKPQSLSEHIYSSGNKGIVVEQHSYHIISCTVSTRTVKKESLTCISAGGSARNTCMMLKDGPLRLHTQNVSVPASNYSIPI